MVTQTEYTTFQIAYDYFNTELFGGQLPQVLISLQRKSKSYGYFCAGMFRNRLDSTVCIDEIAMNPNGFTGRSDREILSTLVHEMAHVWQAHFGKPPRKAYHDKQFAAEMKRLGLYPSSTGAPGGKETGQHLSHYVLDHGIYAAAFERLASTGFRLSWQSAPEPPKESKKSSKTKYTCEGCGLNIWAKPGASVVCAECFDFGDQEPTVMTSEDGN